VQITQNQRFPYIVKFKMIKIHYWKIYKLQTLFHSMNLNISMWVKLSKMGIISFRRNYRMESFCALSNQNFKLMLSTIYLCILKNNLKLINQIIMSNISRNPILEFKN
jgi:hypothetical protein